ncbi:unnamed protein product [Xylocopa violacea]|uniref:Amino acid transporter transmembrane domain-containing protein n=1 Tax=Xylocopa violacea TaxID=135666 RepID=A0ABP1NS87_XYLVO
MLNLAQTSEISFQSGPEKIRKYAKSFAILTNVIVCFVQFQATVIYLLYVSTSLQQVIEFFSGVELNARIYILALFPVICLLGFIPNLKYLTPFSLIGSMFMLTGVCVTLSYAIKDFPDPGRLNAFTAVLPVPMYCTMFLFALHNVTLCMPLENSMTHPTHLPRLVRTNILLNTCLYTTFGFLGYNKYADTTCDTVIKNLPVDDVLAQVIKIAISLSVLCSYGLAFYVPIVILWPMVKPKFESYNLGESVFRLCGIIGTAILALAIPEMIPLLGLLTAFSMTTIMLLIPISVETATKWEEASWFLLAKNICIFIIWVLLLKSTHQLGVLKKYAAITSTLFCKCKNKFYYKK